MFHQHNTLNERPNQLWRLTENQHNSRMSCCTHDDGGLSLYPKHHADSSDPGTRIGLAEVAEVFAKRKVGLRSVVLLERRYESRQKHSLPSMTRNVDAPPAVRARDRHPFWWFAGCAGYTNMVPVIAVHPVTLDPVRVTSTASPPVPFTPVTGQWSALSGQATEDPESRTRLQGPAPSPTDCHLHLDHRYGLVSKRLKRSVHDPMVASSMACSPSMRAALIRSASITFQPFGSTTFFALAQRSTC